MVLLGFPPCDGPHGEIPAGTLFSLAVYVLEVVLIKGFVNGRGGYVALVKGRRCDAGGMLMEFCFCIHTYMHTYVHTYVSQTYVLYMNQGLRVMFQNRFVYCKASKFG